jgi:hypothetical protein
VGWDAATGLGVPSGRGLCAALKSSLVLRRAQPVSAGREAISRETIAAGRELG